MRNQLGFLIVVTAACTSSAPGGSNPGGGSNGSGTTFTPGDTISAVVTMSDGAGGSTSEAWIVLGSTSGLCADATASPPIDRKNQKLVTIQLTDVNGSARAAPTVAGTYTIYPDSGSEPAKSASLTTATLDGTCQPIDADAAQGQSGTVTLSAVSGGVFKGSYDVTLNTGAHVTGTFSPTACPQLATAVTSNATPACM
ncbi:MAG: hypothetical protein ACM31C_34380 [Acidobacteriota bacterium]